MHTCLSRAEVTSCQRSVVCWPASTATQGSPRLKLKEFLSLRSIAALQSKSVRNHFKAKVLFSLFHITGILYSWVLWGLKQVKHSKLKLQVEVAPVDYCYHFFMALNEFRQQLVLFALPDQNLKRKFKKISKLLDEKIVSVKTH